LIERFNLYDDPNDDTFQSEWREGEAMDVCSMVCRLIQNFKLNVLAILPSNGGGASLSIQASQFSTEGVLKKHVAFKNNEDYIFIVFFFPTIKQDTGMVHVGEVVVSGFYCPAGYVAAPFAKEPTLTRVT
jgi:hypothetical protein